MMFIITSGTLAQDLHKCNCRLMIRGFWDKLNVFSVPDEWVGKSINIKTEWVIGPGCPLMVCGMSPNATSDVGDYSF